MRNLKLKFRAQITTEWQKPSGKISIIFSISSTGNNNNKKSLVSSQSIYLTLSNDKLELTFKLQLKTQTTNCAVHGSSLQVLWLLRN